MEPKRGVALSHRRTPEWLLLLAQAYQAAGEIEKGRLAATEGLALLASLQTGATKPRIRKLLEMEAPEQRLKRRFDKRENGGLQVAAPR